MNPLVRIRALLQTISTAVSKALDSLKEALEARRLKQRVKLWKKVSDRGKRGGAKGDEAAGTAPTRLGRKERRIHNRVLKSFFRFTKWGEKKGIPFRTTMGAWEYALKLESVVPALKDDCVDIAGMFGEVMYSNHIIDEQFRSNYIDKIKQVVRD